MTHLNDYHDFDFDLIPIAISPGALAPPTRTHRRASLVAREKSSAKWRPLNSWPELQIRITQLTRERTRRRPCAYLSRSCQAIPIR
jgi:hypothetical protein